MNDDMTNKKQGKTVEIKHTNKNGGISTHAVPVILTWLFRLLLGGTFIFSGFVKAIDPWGTLYKFAEYMSAMGLPALHTLLLTGVFALCSFEFILGFVLCIGSYRKSAPIIALAFMCVMLPLTLWIALSDPVNDCGCFGDFYIISNWATFWKNIFLTIMAIWLVKFSRTRIAIISPAFQWMGVVISLAFILTISFTGYLFQPLIDFRPYKYGTQLTGSAEETSDDNYIFLYEKGDSIKEFGIDDELPDEKSGWAFVERRESGTLGNKEPHTGKDKTFRIWSLDGNDDVTETALTGEGKEVLLLMPDMADVSPATTWKINALHEWIDKQGGDMIAVSNGSPQQIADWEEMALPEYDLYTADDTAIKEVARGNPSVVLLDNGNIVWKSALTSINAELMDEEGAEYSPNEIITQPYNFLKKLTYLYLICLAVPIAMSFMPRIRNAYCSLRREAGKRHS